MVFRLCRHSVCETLRRLWTRGVLALLLVSTGCRATLPELERSPPRPVTTPYTPALRCVGRLLDRYYGRDQVRLTMALWQAKDLTRGPLGGRDELPADITLMMAVALSSVHPGLSVSEIFLTPEWPNLKGALKPDVVMRSGIVSYDQLIFGRGTKADVSVMLPWLPIEGPEIDYQKTHAVSHLSVAMMLFEYPTRVASSFAHAHLGIHVRRVSREVNAGMAVWILGFGVGEVVKRVDSIGTAVMMLAETAVMQTLGRRFRLPYQRCVDDPIQDELLEQRILDHFHAHSPKQQAHLVRELLRGYGVRIALHGPWDSTVDARLDEIKKRHGLAWPPRDRAQAYLALYMKYPLQDLPSADAS